jgi:hypothetical protein
LTSAITRVLPTNTVTRNGITALLDIFTQQANVAKDKIEEQRVRQYKAAAQRVQTEKQSEASSQQTLHPAATETVAEQRVEATAVTPSHTPTFEYSNDGSANNTPIITQDDDDEDKETPVESYAKKLRSHTTRTMTDEWLYSMMEFDFSAITGATSITPRLTASRKYPMQFLCDYANAVIDDETGEIMEYRHLMKNPKHRER